MSEIRYDRLHQRDVIIATERLKRPNDFHPQTDRRKESRICPFCEGNEHLTPSEIFAIRDESSFKDEPLWQTRVVPNLYKALQIESPNTHHYGIFEYIEGFGAHEVLIDTPNHTTSMSQWSDTNFINWLTTLQLRLADLRRDTRLHEIAIFKNEGIQAGATQPHSHTQIIALPMLSRQKRRHFEALYEFYKEHNRALLLSMVDAELEAQPSRIVAQNEKFVAFCPYASSFAFEVILTAKVPLSSLEDLDDAHKAALAELLDQLLHSLQKQLHTLDFNLTLSTPNLLDSLSQAEQFYIRIMPRIYTQAGFELSSDIFINPVSPEMAAKLLRGAID